MSLWAKYISNSVGDWMISYLASSFFASYLVVMVIVMVTLSGFYSHKSGIKIGHNSPQFWAEVPPSQFLT